MSFHTTGASSHISFELPLVIFETSSVTTKTLLFQISKICVC